MKLKTILFLFVSSIAIFSKGEITIWKSYGKVDVNYIKHKRIFQLSSITIKDDASYICLFDETKRKLLELDTKGNYSIDTIQKLIDRQITLPKLSTIDIHGWSKYSASCQPVFINWAIFPNSNTYTNIKVSNTDTLIFDILKNHQGEQRQEFKITNLYGDVYFFKEVKKGDTIELKVIVSEIIQPTELETNELDGHLILYFGNQIAGGIEISNNLEIENTRALAKQLLAHNTKAYKNYALLFLLDNQLIFDAYKIKNEHYSDIETFFGDTRRLSPLAYNLGVRYYKK